MSTAQGSRLGRARLTRQRGQVLPLVALGMVLVIAVAALGIDVGLNFDNQRQVQSVADLAALAGADQAGSLVPASTVQGSTEQAVWNNLGGLPVPSTACGPSPDGQLGDVACTGSRSGYTVTVTYPYTPRNPTLNKELSTSVVAVDITHQNPQSGFADFLGFHSVTIHVHAAATSGGSARQFPFALATRFLDLVGNGTAAAYGSVLIDQCSDSGAGDFVNTGGNNGGLAYNGGATLDVGTATQSGTGSPYTNASAVVVADPSKEPALSTCTNPGTAADASLTWNGMADLVHFQQIAPGDGYNFAYGFNSGPTGCSSPTSPASSCQISPEGSPAGPYPWQDMCWTNTNGGSGVVPLVPVQYVPQNYDAQTGAFTPSSLPAGEACGTATSSAGSLGTLEGSFLQSQFPGFPSYQDPLSLANALSTALGSSTTITTNPAVAAGTILPAGIYIFKGSTNSININNGSLTCQSNGSSENVYPNGCIFIFEQGAGFAMSGRSAAINCSYGSASVSSVPVSTAPCSFYFVDSTPGSNSAFSVTKGAGGTINPIPYCVPASTAAGCATDNFPVIYSNNVSTSALRPITSLQGAAVVTFDQPGSLQVNGTIYVPHGIYDSSANASQITGQVIADTFRLQTGNSAAPAGVSYNSSTAAPVQEPAFLIE